MSYFNHAFRKVLLATGGISNLDGVQLGTPTAPGATTYNQLEPAQITFINPDNFEVSPEADTDPCCAVIVASGSIYPNDKIGKFHGGYQESNKTKTIKPQYVSKYWYVEANAPSKYVTNVGYTPWNVLNPPSSSNPGETGGTCCKEFLCGETYYLRLDVKGSPALRLLDHNAYLTLEAYTGCCPDSPDDPLIAPVPVDPRKVYFAWANQILNSPIINPFVYPIVTFSNDNGTTWTYYYPDTVDLGTLPLPGQGVEYANYSDWSEEAYTADMCAGFTLTGAYEETKFGNCTFQVSDFYELEPVRIYASEVDYTGSPCEFQTLCVGVECYGLQANGVGETVARDFILSESYRQNFFATDFRIREITQGDAIVGCNGFIERNELYDRIYLLHNVPRFYNPSGTFDNDQYLVEIIVKQGDINQLNGVWAAINTWLDSCTTCTAKPTVSGNNCDFPIVPFPGDEVPVL
jgi:hypothetical protein